MPPTGDAYGFKTPHWPGPYHPSWPPAVSSWVMWVMPTFVKTGQIVTASRTSLVVQFQAHPTPTVIPDAHQYWDNAAQYTADAGVAPYTITPCSAPRAILGAPDGSTCSVAQAVAILGSTGKDVRRLLRAGQLEGRQEDGRWVAVELASLSRAASPDATT